MTGNIDHLVFATVMALFTAAFGGLLMVIAWARLLMDPPTKVSAQYPLALYSFTASVCVGTIGSAIAMVFTSDLRTTVWNFALLISFVCVTASSILIRRISGPGLRALRVGSVTLFFFDLFCVIGMILALPGMPLNKK
jgi:hypothetical protein